MKAARLCLFIFLLSFTEQTTAQHDACPSWFIFQAHNGSSITCHCIYSSLTGVKCFPILQFGFCVTYNSSTEIVELGPCPYVSHYNTYTSTGIVDNNVFNILPDNASLLNEFMCGPLNREGPLCGKCKDGYGIALYSYTLECSKCWGHGYGWALHYFLELFPTTVMYFLVVIFHIRATSSPLSALVFMSQIVVYTIRLNVPLHIYIENNVTGFLYVALQVLLVLCGIWSLDFFRSVIPAFCASSSIKTVHALALEYLVAFYPIFLILITYACIKLHDNNFRPVVWLWKPFHRYFVHFRRTWDSKASIINAFTTFLLLSFSKVLFVSFTLLYKFNTSYLHFGSKKCVLYYDPTVECNTQEFAIFAAIAGCVLVIFIILPTLLLIVYPTRLFRRCVSCCGFRRWHALHMFVESFQGQYKDGTNGTCDFRMVSATFLILRILILAFFMNRHNYTWNSSAQCVLLALASYFYAVIKPYKLNFLNNVDLVILFLLEVLSVATTYSVSYHFTYVLLISVLLFPHMVLILYVCYKLTKKAGITQCLKKKYKTLRGCILAITHTSADVEAESDTGSLPDRLINPEEYEPLLPTTEEQTAAEPTESKEPVNKDPRRLTPVYTYGSMN